MKVLFVSENYYPILSGVPVVVRYLAEGLAERGYKVSVVTQKPNNIAREEVISGVMVNRFDIHRNKLYRYSGEINEYIDFTINSNADLLILECSECLTTDLLLPRLGEFKGKILFHSHGMSGFTSKIFAVRDNIKHTLGTTYNWINAKYYFNYKFKKAFKYIDAFMCLSEVDSGIDYVNKYAKKVYILDNACDDMFFVENTEPNVIDRYVELNNKHYMISCANYTVVKNQKEMINQYYQSESSKSYSLVCIGSQENKYYQECLDLKDRMDKRYGYRDVKLLTGILRRDIPVILKNACIYLVTSSYEQYSISIIEAMSQGIPFISTNVGNTKLLPGGIVIDEISDMHNIIDELLLKKQKYFTYSKAGKEFAFNNCRISEVVNKLERIIKETISN